MADGVIVQGPLVNPPLSFLSSRGYPWIIGHGVLLWHPKNNTQAMELRKYDADQPISAAQTEAVRNFLFKQLEQYGDAEGAILKCIQYAMKINNAPGGAVFTASIDGEIVGAVVTNKTGMSDYIPENILVYIATHSDYRGQGIGKKLMNYAIENSTGDIALHVEKDNPARFLYEKLGFTNPYLEMRLKRK